MYYSPQSNQSNGFKLEAVIVCYNYADFLAHTLPLNMTYFDRVVVVTHPDDQDTINLCNQYSVDCVQTTEFHNNGDKFNKGRAINIGISHLKNDGWIMQLDADIVLPHNFRNRLIEAQLDSNNIYGADRLNVGSYENWMANKHKLVPAHRHNYLVDPVNDFTMGARLLHREHGYVPIGYFELFHSKHHRKYPIVCGGAEHSDVVFAIQWPRENRVLLPSFFTVHLESADSKHGQNWLGRKTQRFE